MGACAERTGEITKHKKIMKPTKSFVCFVIFVIFVCLVISPVLISDSRSQHSPRRGNRDDAAHNRASRARRLRPLQYRTSTRVVRYRFWSSLPDDNNCNKVYRLRGPQ